MSEQALLQDLGKTVDRMAEILNEENIKMWQLSSGWVGLCYAAIYAAIFSQSSDFLATSK